MEMLKKMNCDPDGKHAVVVGRSKLVGTPVARLLQNANCYCYDLSLAYKRSERSDEDLQTS
jgi:5,10-methylene-tetrahydrofolate dehydrogenase/methenyl tetrahydrofolate cyclohydrolase